MSESAMIRLRPILLLIAMSSIACGCYRSTSNTHSSADGTNASDDSQLKSGDSAIAGKPLSDTQFRQRYNLALGLMGQFKYSQAYEEFSELRQFAPENIDLSVDTAIARLNMAGDGDLQEALQILKECLSKDPKHPRANYCVGLIESYMGPPANPTSYLRVAAEGVPDDADAAYLLAKALEQDEALQDAKKEYLRSLELNPYYASSLLGLARIARMSGDAAESARLIEQFENMKANPNGKVFEFAYKRMGKLGEVGNQPTSSQPADLPPGELFQIPSKCDSLESINSLLGNASSVDLSVADIDQDGSLDVVLLTDNGMACVMDLAGTRRLASGKQMPWLNSTSVSAVAFGDIDQNGKLDIVLSRRGENQLWYQMADEWKNSSEPTIGGGNWETVACRLYDSDHDGDLDILFVNRDAPVQIINNNRDGTFRILELSDSIQSQTATCIAAALGDFDNHRDTDIFLIREDGTAAVIWNDRLWDHRLASDLPTELAEGSVSAAVSRDVDHDGRLDLVVRLETEVAVWSRRASGWERLFSVPMPSGSLPQFAVVDLPGDGKLQVLADLGDHFAVTDWEGVSQPVVRLDSGRQVAAWTLAPLRPNQGYSLIFVDSDGQLFVTDPGAGRFDFFAAQFAGAENAGESMRSNLSGIGTRWKAQVGSNWSTGQVFPFISGSCQSQMPEMIGMQGQQQIDFIAVDWTDGVFQAELGLKPDSVRSITETQRQLASCPIVFAWNGEQFEFVTDVLGVGGIGFLVAPHEYAQPRAWEHLHLTPKQLQPKGGRLVVKLAEPMEEACYVQSARLKAVQLPIGWSFLVDERFGGSEPLPTGQIRYYRDEWPILFARSSLDDNCTEQLLQADGKAPDIGPIDQRFIGLVDKEFVLEFSFGTFDTDDASSDQYGLLIDGWVEYPYSQTVFAAWQANRSYLPPSLEVEDESGVWKLAWQHFGFPAGMPRRMFLPLPSHARPGCSLRIRSELQVYWDRITLVRLEECPEAKVLDLELMNAELKRAGFAKRSTHGQFRPHYDYSQRSGTWDARHHPGFYTRFGSVDQLLQIGPGDRPLVIFGPGEELHLEFLARSKRDETGTAHEESGVVTSDRKDKPNEPAGFVLELRGWCKDLDLYTNQGDSLGPLPNSSRVDGRLELEYNSRYQSGPWYSTSVP